MSASSAASDLAALVHALRRARRTVALTGAGVSTECGIPDFRSDRGIWAQADPMEVGSIDGFREDPARFYAFWGDFFARIGEVPPGSGHRMLAALESRGLLAAVVTQNIDGLHQAAGSRAVIEVHGSWRTAHCLRCRTRFETAALLADARFRRAPHCEACGGLVKPDVVLFGELLGPALDDARRAIDTADLVVVLGSSLAVAPVSELVPHAAHRGATIAIVNREPTGHDDVATIVARTDIRGAVDVVARELALPL